MDFITGIHLAGQTLTHHKVRCALSMLGICIGVGAFICSVAIGRGASAQIDERLKNLSAVPIRPDAIAAALGFAGAVGIFFGLYPAQRASLLDPIDALRG